MSPIKKIVLPSATLFFSVSFFSFLLTLGLLIGYLGTFLFHQKLIVRGKIRKEIWVPFGKWKIHFHHWMMGVITLLIIWATGLTNFFPQILYGMIGGVIFHDFYDGQDWHRIITKK